MKSLREITWGPIAHLAHGLALNHAQEYEFAKPAKEPTLESFQHLRGPISTNVEHYLELDLDHWILSPRNGVFPHTFWPSEERLEIFLAKLRVLCVLDLG